MKKLHKLITVLLVTFLIFICAGLSLFGYEKYYLNRFENTNLKISQNELEEVWGKPDKVFRYQNKKEAIFYYTFLNEFVFNVNESENVELKYKENF